MNEVIAKLGSLGDRLEQVVGEIGKTLGGGEGGSLFTKIDKLVTDNGPKLTETVSNLQEITTKIRSGEGTLGHLVNDPKLHDELLASVSEIKTAADRRAHLRGKRPVAPRPGEGGQGRARARSSTTNRPATRSRSRQKTSATSPTSSTAARARWAS